MSILTETTAPPKPPRVGRAQGVGQPEEPFRFDEIVQAAYPDFVATQIADDVADGFVPLQAYVIRATFSIDRERALARMVVGFHVPEARTMEFQRLERNLNQQPILPRVWLSVEDQKGFVGAVSAYGGDPKNVAKATASSVRRALHDRDIESFLRSEADEDDNDRGTDGGAL